MPAEPRLCLHNATVDKDVREGDVKITGRGVEVHDGPVRDAFRQEVKARTGFDPGTDYHLFRVDVTGVAAVRPDPGGGFLLIEWWRQGEAPQRLERH